MGHNDGDTGLAAVQAALAAHPYDATRGYSPVVRAAVVSYALAAREAGVSWREVAAGLPVSERSVRAWQRAAERAVPPTGALVPVCTPVEARAVPEPPEVRGLILRSPGGYQLEGLDVETAVRVLRSLG